MGLGSWVLLLLGPNVGVEQDSSSQGRRRWIILVLVGLAAFAGSYVLSDSVYQNLRDQPAGDGPEVTTVQTTTVSPNAFKEREKQTAESNSGDREGGSEKSLVRTKTKKGDPLKSGSPIFFNVNPGSTGTRTMFNAACGAGLPSVHHATFCVSQRQGFRDVPEHVMAGLRAHAKIMRGYRIANKCTRQIQTNMDKVKEGLCDMDVLEWAREMKENVLEFVRGGIVGIFDTPYPFMASYFIKVAEKENQTPIYAITERDSKSWAKSRTKHPLFVCKADVEDNLASEFDFLGCVDRAAQSRQGQNVTLHFDDVFLWFEKGSVELLEGFEKKMERHQKRYLPLTTYNPHMFERTVTTPELSGEILRAIDWKKYKGDGIHAKPLSCRGRYEWDLETDESSFEWPHPQLCNT